MIVCNRRQGDANREAVAHLCDAHGVSQRSLPGSGLLVNHERGACDVLQVDRSTVRYRSKRADDAELREAIKAVARERRRFGYPLAGR